MSGFRVRSALKTGDLLRDGAPEINEVHLRTPPAHVARRKLNPQAPWRKRRPLCRAAGLIDFLPPPSRPHLR